MTVDRKAFLHPEKALAERRLQLHAMNLEQLHTEISRLLRQVDEEVRFVGVLLHMRPKTLGFVTAEGLDTQDEIRRQERADRRHGYDTATLNHQRHLLQVDRRGNVRSPAPGDVGAMSTRRVVTEQLKLLVRLVARELARTEQIWIARRLPNDPTVTQLTAHLRLMAMELTTVRAGVDTALRLDETLTTAAAYLYGRQFLGGPCPHCQLDTLVVHWIQDSLRDDFLVRCEQPLNARDRKPCVCPDPMCGCKLDPVVHRHLWEANLPPSSSRSWEHLATRINTIPKEHDR